MRKLRWALEGRGKRAARVIYYLHNEHVTLFASDAFAKNEKADLKPDDVVRLRRVVKVITDAIAKKGRL